MKSKYKEYSTRSRFSEEGGIQAKRTYEGVILLADDLIIFITIQKSGLSMYGQIFVQKKNQKISHAICFLLERHYEACLPCELAKKVNTDVLILSQYPPCRCSLVTE